MPPRALVLTARAVIRFAVQYICEGLKNKTSQHLESKYISCHFLNKKYEAVSQET